MRLKQDQDEIQMLRWIQNPTENKEPELKASRVDPDREKLTFDPQAAGLPASSAKLYS